MGQANELPLALAALLQAFLVQPMLAFISTGKSVDIPS